MNHNKEELQNVLLTQDELMTDVFHCKKTKFYQHMNQRRCKKMPIVKVNKSYYSTRELMNKWKCNMVGIPYNNQHNRNDELLELSYSELCEIFHCSPAKLYEILKEKDSMGLPIKKNGTKYYLTVDMLESWIEKYSGYDFCY